MEGKIGRQPGQPEGGAQRPEVPQAWKEFNQWERQYRRQVKKGLIPPGTFPEGTPQLMIDLTTKTTREERLLGAIFGGYPSVEEVQARSLEDVQRLKDQLETRQGARQLTRQASRLLESQVKKPLQSLTQKERQVLRLRFGLDDGKSRSYEEVAKELGCSESEVQDLEKSGLRMLRGGEREETSFN